MTTPTIYRANQRVTARELLARDGAATRASCRAECAKAAREARRLGSRDTARAWVRLGRMQ